MPEYIYRCREGHEFGQWMTVARHTSSWPCICGQLASQIITPPLSVSVQADVCYDSPVDGKPITSRAQREEDMKRNGCVPFDPGMKTDYIRRQRDGEIALEKTISESVEESIAKMSTRKRGQLFSELTEQGKTAEVIRTTA